MQRRRNPNYLKQYKDHAGRWVRQYRRNGRLIRLPDGRDFNQAFWDAYYEAEKLILHGGSMMPAAAARLKPGSFSAVLASYYKDAAFGNLGESTQNNVRGALESVRNEFGDLPLKMLRAKNVMDLVSAKAAATSAGTAKILLQAMRGFCRYAVAAEFVLRDPTTGVKSPKVETEGYWTWTDEEVEQFLAYWPEGSMPHLALSLHLYTAQRRSDVVRLGRQHLRDGVLRFTQQKTKGQEAAKLAIPVHRELQLVLDRLPAPQPNRTGQVHLTFLVNAKGEPIDAHQYGAKFRQWVKDAGLPARCTSHGLRKHALCKLAELGLSALQLQAISGHANLSELQKYVERANREKLAGQAIATWEKADAPILKLVRNENETV